jgi:2-methylcitrate dehydratase PrpD
MMSGATAELAAFVSNLEPASVPASVMQHAKRSVLDTIGCALHGSSLPWCRVLREQAVDEGGTAQAQLWGTSLRLPRTRAAWFNATAAHAFEYDDVHMGGMIHVGALTVPAALAIAENKPMSGASLLASIVAGCEVGARVGRAVGTPHFAAGYHPQGTVGVFSAAASAAHASGHSAELAQQTLGIAGSHAAGLMAAQEGAMTKRLHSGHAAQSGVLSAELAARGFTGIPDVLEAEFGGFCSTMGGPETDLGLLTAGLGVIWETEQIGFKPYPSCAAAQTSIEAAWKIREQSPVEARRISAIEVHCSTHARLHCGWPYEPAGVTAAQMSIPYGVARMLVSGHVGTADFSDEAIAAADVLEVAAKITVIGDPEVDALGPSRRYGVRVVVRTTDGDVFESRVQDRSGNSSSPLSDETLTAKFVEQAGPIVGDQAATDLLGMISHLEDLTDVRELSSALSRTENGESQR